MTVINPIDDNTFGWAAWFNALANAHGAGGIVSGCSISKGTGDWDIDVTSGTIFEGSTQASISSGTVTITDSSGLSSGESRVTLITADTGDALASTDGAAAADPATPDIPAGEVLLGFVVVSNGDSTVADSDKFDIPALRQNDNILYKDGSAHELDVSDLAGGDGTAGQFPQSNGSAVTWESLVGSWSDVTSSRSSGSQETNNTGQPLFVKAFTTQSTASGSASIRVAEITLQVDGTKIDHSHDGTYDSGGGLTSEVGPVSVSGVVPPGDTYEVNVSGNVSLDKWFESSP